MVLTLDDLCFFFVFPSIKLYLEKIFMIILCSHSWITTDCFGPGFSGESSTLFWMLCTKIICHLSAHFCNFQTSSYCLSYPLHLRMEHSEEFTVKFKLYFWFLFSSKSFVISSSSITVIMNLIITTKYPSLTTLALFIRRIVIIFKVSIIMF